MGLYREPRSGFDFTSELQGIASEARRPLSPEIVVKSTPPPSGGVRGGVCTSRQVVRAYCVAQPSARGGVRGLDQLGRHQSLAPGPTAVGPPGSPSWMPTHRGVQLRPCWLGRPLSAVSTSQLLLWLLGVPLPTWEPHSPASVLPRDRGSCSAMKSHIVPLPAFSALLPHRRVSVCH